MTVLRVKNWARFQHYRGRNPPWIRLYRSLLDDRAYRLLGPAAQAVLIDMWLLASETNGEIPYDPDELAFRTRRDRELVISAVLECISAGFLTTYGDDISYASNMLASCKQDASKRYIVDSSQVPDQELPLDDNEAAKRLVTDDTVSSYEIELVETQPDDISYASNMLAGCKQVASADTELDLYTEIGIVNTKGGSKELGLSPEIGEKRDRETELESTQSLLSNSRKKRKNRPEQLPRRPGKSLSDIIEHLSHCLQQYADIAAERWNAEQLRRVMVELVFAYWAKRTGHQKTWLDRQREALMAARLEENGNDVHELLYAVDGWFLDPTFQHLRQDEGRKLDGVENIFRNRARVERLASHCEGWRQGIPHPMVQKYLDPLLQTHQTPPKSNDNGPRIDDRAPAKGLYAPLPLLSAEMALEAQKTTPIQSEAESEAT